MVAQPPPRSRFFLVLVALFVLLGLLGFWDSFVVPFAQGRFTRGTRVAVHGALLFAWLVVLLAQAVLAALGRLRWHAWVGWGGAALVLPVALSGVYVSAMVAAPGVSGPDADGVLSVFAGALVSFVLFVTLSGAAILLRRRPEVHKRLLVIAMLPVLGAAVARVAWLRAYLEWVSVGVLGLIVAHDLWRMKRVQVATVVAGAAVLTDLYAVPTLRRTPAAHSVARQALVVVEALGAKG